MPKKKIYPKLEIPKKIAACSGLGNTKARVLAAFSIAGLTNHMQTDLIIEKYWKVLDGEK